MRLPRQSPIVGLLCLLVCCGGPEAPVFHTYERLRSGAVLVTNTGLESWQADAKWELRVSLKLGDGDGQGPATFGLVTALQVDSAGQIYVLDYLAQEIRVFDRFGGLVRRIGGKGQGPGEFVGAEELHLSRAGQILVPDPRMSRYSLFSADGDLIRTWSRWVRGSAPLSGFLADGRFVDWSASFPEEGPEVAVGATTLLQPLRFSRDFRTADTLPAVRWERLMVPDGSRPQVFFAPRLTGCLQMSGAVVFANSDRLEIVARGLEGDTTVVFTLPADPARVTQADHEAVRQRLAGRPGLAEQYLAGLPETKPVILGVVCDDSGHVYVVPQTDNLAAGSALYVFRETGEFVGVLELPIPLRTQGQRPVIVATGGSLVYVAEDALDIPRIVRVDLTRPE